MLFSLNFCLVSGRALALCGVRYALRYHVISLNHGAGGRVDEKQWRHWRVGQSAPGDTLREGVTLE